MEYVYLQIQPKMYTHIYGVLNALNLLQLQVNADCGYPEKNNKLFFLCLFPKDIKSYSWFHIKGTWSVQSFSEDYLSIP